MKPDWKDAPPWARYLAMDSDGDWRWFEKPPKPSSNRARGYWIVAEFGSRAEPAYCTHDANWSESVEERP